jgi:hypothetical protein
MELQHLQFLEMVEGAHQMTQAVVVPDMHQRQKTPHLHSSSSHLVDTGASESLHAGKLPQGVVAAPLLHNRGKEVHRFI